MWIDPNTRRTARNHDEVRALRPNWSGPMTMTDEMVLALGFLLVKPATPAYDPIYQRATELAPVQINGVWTQQWQVDSLSHDQSAAGFAAAVQAKQAEIDAARLRANFGTFEYDGNLFSCDALSRSDLDATAGYIGLFGTFAPGFPNAWKKADGGYILMPTVEEFKAFYIAFYNQGLANLQKAELLKQQLAQATTAAEIAAIQWATA